MAAPSNVIFTSTTTSITFTWDEIPCGSRGGSITYEYVFDSNTGTSTSTSVTFNQLTPCSSFQFKVRATNEVGRGTYSSEVTGETKDQSKSESKEREEKTHIVENSPELLWLQALIEGALIFVTSKTIENIK